MREFLRLGMGVAVPDHSLITVMRQRLPDAFYGEVFRWVLGAAAGQRVWCGRRHPGGRGGDEGNRETRTG